MIDKIFKIGLLLLIATFLWLYYQDVQKNRYRIWPGAAVFDTATGRIYSEDGSLTDPVKRAQAYTETVESFIENFPEKEKVLADARESGLSDRAIAEAIRKPGFALEPTPMEITGWPSGVPLNIITLRANYPAYKDVPDEELARRIREKYYPNVREDVFNRAFLGEPAPEEKKP